MSENTQKLTFLSLVIALALFSRVAYSGMHENSAGGSGSSGTMSSLSADAALVVPSSSVLTEPDASVGADGVSSGIASSGNQASMSASSSPFAQVGDVPAPAVADEASLVADLETGTVYFGTNLETRWPLASVTKLMTASLVIDDMSLDQKITITPEDIAVDPSQKLLAAGETFTVSDLLHVLLLPSSNVAAEAFANYYGMMHFVAQMNARAENWGMTDTYYDDPSGLSAANESTPDDLLKLAQHIYVGYPQILAITRTPQVTIVDQSSGKSILVTSINNFAGRADFVGGKTGYTDEADGNLLSIFQYENRPILVIIMGTSDTDRFDNTMMMYNWFTENYK